MAILCTVLPYLVGLTHYVPHIDVAIICQLVFIPFLYYKKIVEINQMLNNARYVKMAGERLD